MSSDSPQQMGDVCCPVCLAIPQRLFRTRGYWIRRCPECHHRCAELSPTAHHVGDVYGNQYFQGGGAGYSDYLSEAVILRAHGRRYGKLLAHYRAPGAMLDVGAAAGFILCGFQDAGWQGKGIEPNPSMATYGREQLGLQMEVGTFETFHSDELYDLITMIQVVAHFQQPRTAFQIASEVLKPNGLLLIETWNRECWTARIFGRRWHEYSPPSVLHWFSPTGLQRLAIQFDFRELARGRPRKWFNAAHAKSLLRHQDTAGGLGRLAARIVEILADRLAIPYPGDDHLDLVSESMTDGSASVFILRHRSLNFTFRFRERALISPAELAVPYLPFSRRNKTDPSAQTVATARPGSVTSPWAAGIHRMLCSCGCGAT